jgi:hypothetical protein
MGLDQYAYVAAKANQSDEFWADAVMDPTTKEYVNPNVTKPREIAYWRKHPNLQGWMRKLWEAKGGKGEFNGDELELTSDDIDMLEEDVLSGHLPTTSGFFFGNPADEYYRQQDLKFISQARAELFCGLRVFYNSSW